MRIYLLLLALVSAALVALPSRAPAPSVEAAYPGLNGKVLFESDRDGGNRELYAMNANGSGQTNLTNSEAYEQNSSWSPDGTKIAFTALTGGYDEIFVMNADGSNVIQLTRIEDAPAGFIRHDANPNWSPDGTRIVFNRDLRAFDGSTANSDIWVMNANGSGQARLTDSPAADYEPAWSPDGSRIAFVTERDDVQGDYVVGSEIYVMNPDGSGQTNLTNSPGVYDFGPDWSPDGRRIAFSTDRNGSNYEIYSMLSDGTGITNITNHPSEDFNPAWSPDGRMIAFASDRGGNTQVYVMKADGSEQTRLTNNAAEDGGFFVDWQPLPSLVGDADCDGDVDAVDALLGLRMVGGLSAAGCVLKANVKCDDPLDAIDSLYILRYVAGLSVSLPAACTAIGR